MPGSEGRRTRGRHNKPAKPPWPPFLDEKWSSWRTGAAAIGVGFSQMRRRLPWLLALPVMAAGSLAAHALSYLVLSARAAEGGAEVAERSSTGSASNLVLFVGVLAAMTIVAGGWRGARRRSREECARVPGALQRHNLPVRPRTEGGSRWGHR